MKSLFLAFVAGFIFGVCNIATKILIGDLTSVLILFLNQNFYLISIFAGLGFIFFQFSLKNEKSSSVVIVQNSAMILAVFLGSVFILKEDTSLYEKFGIVIIVVSTMILLIR